MKPQRGTGLRRPQGQQGARSHDRGLLEPSASRNVVLKPSRGEICPELSSKSLGRAGHAVSPSRPRTVAAHGWGGAKPVRQAHHILCQLVLWEMCQHTGTGRRARECAGTTSILGARGEPGLSRSEAQAQIPGSPPAWVPPSSAAYAPFPMPLHAWPLSSPGSVSLPHGAIESLTQRCFSQCHF